MTDIDVLPVDIGSLTEEELEKLAEAFTDSLPGDVEEKLAVLDAYEEQMLIEKARGPFSLEGFKAFFKYVFRLDLLWYMEDAIRELYKSKAVVVEAYFESTKTTTLSIAFFAYFIAKHPTTSNLICQVSDDKGVKTAGAVADLIEVNPRWKHVFPHIVRDQRKAWGEKSGYEIQMTHKDATLAEEISYEEWQEMNVERKDASFIGLGYNSSQIIGMRVTGLMVVDDIHDEGNTFSDRNLQSTITRLKGTILSRATKEAWRLFVGTPWVEGDTIDFIKNTGLYTHVYIPVYETVEEEVAGAFYWNKLKEWVKPAWSSMFDEAYLDRKYIELGPADFARFMLLDLEKIGDRVFYWQEYPHEKIETHWPHYGGVDFASILKESQRNDPNRSYFAMAYGTELPTGRAVITGGVRERCTPDEAEIHMEKAQNIHQNWRGAAVEQDGKGEVFVYGLMQRRPNLVFVPMPTRGRGKEKRLEREMSPWFANGVVMVSTADTPFLNALRKELHDYPHTKHKDCLDATYWMLRMMPHVLKMENATGDGDRLPPPHNKSENKEGCPLSALGRN